MSITSITGIRNKAAGLIIISNAEALENNIQYEFLFSFKDFNRYEQLIIIKLTNRDSDRTENSSTRKNVDEINTEIAAAKYNAADV